MLLALFSIFGSSIGALRFSLGFQTQLLEEEPPAQGPRSPHSVQVQSGQGGPYAPITYRSIGSPACGAVLAGGCSTPPALPPALRNGFPAL